MGESDDTWIGRGLPLVGAAAKLLGTAQRFGLALYARIRREGEESDFAFVEPMIAEFLEGLAELKESLPERDVILLALENVEEILAEVRKHPTAQAVGEKVRELVATRSDEVIGKVIDAAFLSGAKTQAVGEETAMVLRRVEEMLDGAIERWLGPQMDLPNVDEEKE
ncbi:MAG: hypothetical protein ACNA8W_01375 [Bradymonadaceae bacterium]